MKIQVQALDTLFFRDGKPFTGGEEVWADMLFPPSPSVIYGALRGKYFSEQIATFQQANEPNDPTNTLKIKAIALQSDDTVLFPIPLDYGKEKGDPTNKAFLLKNRVSVPVSNCPVKNVFVGNPTKIIENIENGLLDCDGMNGYLSGQAIENFYMKLSDYIIPEPKLGIGRENQTHVSQDGRLYRIDMRRLESKMTFGNERTQSISIFIEFEGLSIPEQGLFRLGGEGKAVHYATSEGMLPEKPQLSGTRFKLYLATPASFEQGWLPKWIDKNTLQGVYQRAGSHKSVAIRLETAMIGKPMVIGGFDMQKHAPKKMRKAVPAGSVYYFEIVNGAMQDALDLFHAQAISDYDAQQGFGLTFVGGVA